MAQWSREGFRVVGLVLMIAGNCLRRLRRTSFSEVCPDDGVDDRASLFVLLACKEEEAVIASL